MIERVWIYTWRLRASEPRDALGERIRASLEMHLKAMIERVWRCTWRWSIWRRYIEIKAWTEAETLSIGQTQDRGNVESSVQQGPPIDDR